MAKLSRRLRKIELTERQLQDMVEYIREQEDVLALILYGSYATALQTALSDVDLAVLPMPGVRLDVHRELELWGELAGLGRSDDINFVNLRRVPVTLQMRVLESGRALFCRDETLLTDFAEHVIKRYCDFEPDLRSLYRDFDTGLREEFL